MVRSEPVGGRQIPSPGTRWAAEEEGCKDDMLAGLDAKDWWDRYPTETQRGRDGLVIKATYVFEIGRHAL